MHMCTSTGIRACVYFNMYMCMCGGYACVRGWGAFLCIARVRAHASTHTHMFDECLNPAAFKCCRSCGETGKLPRL